MSEGSTLTLKISVSSALSAPSYVECSVCSRRVEVEADLLDVSSRCAAKVKSLIKSFASRAAALSNCAPTDSSSSAPEPTRRDSDTPGKQDFLPRSPPYGQTYSGERLLRLQNALAAPTTFRIEWHPAPRDPFADPEVLPDLHRLVKKIRLFGGTGLVTECGAGSTIEVGLAELGVVVK
jgi:hypothetical protein